MAPGFRRVPLNVLVLIFCLYSLFSGWFHVTAAPVRERGLLASLAPQFAKVFQFHRLKRRGYLSSGSRISSRIRRAVLCESALGVQVRWIWLEQSQGVIFWVITNAGNETLSVVLNRGASNVPAYPFGGAFFPAYLTDGTDGVQLATIGTGPYPPVTTTPTLPLALIDAQQTGVAFVLVIPARTEVFIPEGGFVNGIVPFCESVVDVDFVANQGMNMTYSVCEECIEFYAQTEMNPPYDCPTSPMETNIPVYRPRNESASFDFWPQKGSIIEMGPANFTGAVEFTATDSAASCPSSDTGGSSSSVLIGCFPAAAVVEQEDGEFVSLASLKRGTRIATLVQDERRGWVKHFTTVYAFADSQPDADSLTYLELHTSRGDTLLLTPDHLLYASLSNDSRTKRFVRALHVSPGMALVRADGTQDSITHIAVTKAQGAFAPLTFEGTMLVNGYLVSSYADVASHERAHLVFAPLRAWHRLFGTPTRADFAGLHGYAQLLISLRNLIQSK
ncbi:hypothetical protein F1559_002943 [Cyanidiococcus yangmingshanensis]|uniref:Hint domain-containing protein n=1 Tax=Cyanidiococcus yangmingshanensis TaxID=2690220 RepID=A0A7J7IM39_9RHOD|nr:hypothetical protein F1559_002943 [Cyanidiococcus yangmingshanensis]